MGAFFKIRINNIVDVNNSASIRLAYSDGFTAFDVVSHTFSFVDVRTQAFEVEISNNLNQALKDAIDLDLVPSGDWTTSIDDYYLYVESTVAKRKLLSYGSTNLDYTIVVYDNQDAAIELLEGFATDALLNAFNDNVLRFKITGEDKVYITANDELPINLYASPIEEFYLNLKDFATALINQNKFEDEILPNIEVDGYVYPDPSLFLAIDLRLTAEVYSSVLKFYFLKSVAQIAGFQEKLISKNYVLLDRATYYEGYPFDIPVFSTKNQQVILHNKTTSHKIALDFSQYMNRLFLSQGSENFTLDNILSMQTGVNRLSLEFGPTDKIDVVVLKKESRCAPYFKFYRNGGGYGYIRFESEVGVRNSAQEGESIRMDFDGIQNTLRRSITEKETKVTMELQTESLELYEMENFKDFLGSPRVEMYVGDLFQKQTEKSWVGVNVSSRSLNTRRPKAVKLKENVTVEFDLYNLHL